MLQGVSILVVSANGHNFLPKSNKISNIHSRTLDLIDLVVEARALAACLLAGIIWSSMTNLILDAATRLAAVGNVLVYCQVMANDN